MNNEFVTIFEIKKSGKTSYSITYPIPNEIYSNLAIEEIVEIIKNLR